jgi:hypothetical protein
LQSEVAGVLNSLDIADVEFVPGLKKNLLSYVRLEGKGVCLVYEGRGRYFANTTSKFAVHESGNLLVVRLTASRSKTDLICCTLAEQDHPVVHEDSLYQFHACLGHQSYTSIQELASKPESGIKLTDHEKPHCITCAEGKQTCNSQSNQGSGKYAPSNRIGVVVCSDLKSPITPND